jgi:probable F420-dependent oxidoreductase
LYAAVARGLVPGLVWDRVLGMPPAPAADVRIGVQLIPQRTTVEAYRRAWLRLDRLGVDSLWTWDHFFPLDDGPDRRSFEGWTLLAALAPETTRARVGCLVLAVGYRNPALVAAMAATLDHVAGGRLVLGPGAGWYERDYAEYGYRFEAARDRLRDLERALGVIRARWASGPPRPLRGTVPILVGGDGEQTTLRIVAQHADLWNGFGPPRDWARRNRALDAWCAEVGRDPGAIERTAYVTARDAARLGEYVRAGARHLIVALGPPFDPSLIGRVLAWRDRARLRTARGG